MGKRLRAPIRWTIKAFGVYAGFCGLIMTPMTEAHAETANPPHVIASVSKTGVIDSTKLKKQVVQSSTSQERGIAPDTVDIDKSVAIVSPTSRGTAKVSVYPAVKDKKGNVSLNAKPVVGTALIRKQYNAKPTLELASDKVTVNNGDKFNAQAFISQVATSDGDLPALTIDDSNVNTKKDGTYTVTYKAVDNLGKTEEKTLNVQVKTPDEVIEARKKAAEEKARKEAEEKARQEEEAKKNAAEEAKQAMIAQQANQQAAVSNIAIGNGSAAGQAIVATARQFLGYPYVSGGSSPSGFDCSGFTQYVFGLNGIGLNRTAASQASNGTLIPADQAQAGDLMLWTGHAAIYEGNGYVIHATNPRMGVRESSVNAVSGSGQFLGFYRVNGVN